MMKDLEIAFTAKEVTAFGGVSLLYKMLDNCHSRRHCLLWVCPSRALIVARVPNS